MADEKRIKNPNDRAEELENAMVVRYNPIKKDEAYDRKTFVYAQEQLNDLQNYHAGLQKDHANPGVRKDLSELLFENEASQRRFQTSDEQAARNITEGFLSDGIESMARYAEKNKRYFLDEILDGKAFMGLAMNVPLYKTGKKEYDNLSELIGKIKAIDAAEKENDINKMREIVLKKLESDKISDGAKNFLSYWANDARFLMEMIEIYRSANSRALAEAVTKDGEHDREKLKNLVEGSLDVAYEKLEEETNEKKKKDIWKENIKPYYVRMAQLAYELEKKKLEKDEETDESRKKNERKAERRALGMAA
ncbi:MAG: hypothetical protein QXD13_01535 [Candidatus Pacearchaeota archaeon]